jgi:hypothetical protein
MDEPRQIKFRLAENAAVAIEEWAASEGKPLATFIAQIATDFIKAHLSTGQLEAFERGEIISMSKAIESQREVRRDTGGTAIADAKDLNLRGRLDELINEVIRIRMSLFGIAQYAQGGAFISKPWLESINAQCRELAPKTNYRTP